jgi:spore coat protein U-like protein
MFRARLVGLVVLATAVVAALPGIAAAQANFIVSATVTENCTVGANPLNFGDYNTLGAAVTGSTTLTIRCTRGTSATISLDNGANATPGGVRQMASGSERLRYDLFQDNTYSTRWGSGGSGLAYTAASRASVDRTIYGRIDADQDVTPGSYQDTISVTVNY